MTLRRPPHSHEFEKHNGVVSGEDSGSFAGDPETVRGKSRLSIHTFLALGVIGVAAAWLRLHRLGGHDLWLDEAYSVLFAKMPAGRFWKLMWSREGNMLLYYLALRAWMHLGDTEGVVRLLSVVFGVASIPMIYFLGRDLFSRTTGMIAAALLAVHELHIFFSQDARSYTLLVFLLLWSAWLFVRLVRFPDRRLYRVIYPIVSGLAMYAHLLGALVTLSQWLSLNRVGARRLGWKRSLGVVATFFVVALPMEAFAILKNKGQLDWTPPLTVSGFVEGMYAITGGGGAVLLLLYLGLGVLAIIEGYRSGSEELALSTRLLSLWVVFPIIVMIFYSLHKPLFYWRYLMMCLPGVILLAAEGVTIIKRSRRWVAWAWLPVVLLVAGISFRAAWHYFDAPIWPDWKAATDFVLANERPGDAVCFSGNGAAPFLYYMQRERRLDWRTLPNERYSHGVRCLGDFPEKVAQANSGYRRAWLLSTDGGEQQYEWILKLLIPRFGPPAPLGSFACPPGKISVNLLSGTNG